MAVNKGLIIFVIILLVIIISVVLYFVLRKKEEDEKPDKDDDPKKTKKTSTTTGNIVTVNLDDPYTVLNMSGYYTNDSLKSDSWDDVSPARNHMTGPAIRGELTLDANGFVSGTSSSGFKIPDRTIGLYNDDYTMFFLGKQLSNLVSMSDDSFFGRDDIIYGMEQSNGRKRMNGVDISNTPLSIIISGEDASQNALSLSYEYGEPRMIQIQLSDVPEGNLNVSVNSTNVSTNITSLTSTLRDLLPNYSSIAGRTDDIVLKKPISYSVNIGENNGDFAFKELLFYKSILDDSRIARIERYFKKEYSNLFNDVEYATFVTCKDDAKSKDANAFAINLETKQCIIYEDVAQLLNSADNVARISYCTDGTKEISNGCN